MARRAKVSNFLSRYRVIPALLHSLLFVIVWALAIRDPRPILDGAGRWGIGFFMLADFPFSVIGFSLIWDKRLTLGLLIWGGGGALLWYFLGSLIFRNRENLRN